ncbi:MAG: type 11 methyltransferase [Elusimicrobia bacterium]|nr:MAG: type 11 methyltransferase [Elusimicrobiota bacterium]KAF0156991.1 MAG: type 11 methyltransferase [Elusimicrobiota bacterium]
MESVERCPACGASPLLSAGGLARCRACGLARAEEPCFSEPRYGGLDEREIYSLSKSRIITELVSDLSAFRPGGGRLLDVGCASGEIMKAAASAGWDCSGVEISPRLAAEASAAGFPVHAGRLETLRTPDSSFDAVAFYDVLSLVEDPRPLLARAFALLRPGGAVFIRELNAAFHLRALALSGLPPLRALGLRPGVVHNWNYTPAAMRAFLRSSGFEGIRLRNSRPTSGDPYATGGRLGAAAVGIFKSAFFAAARAAGVLSGGRVLAASAFAAAAFKPGGQR